MATLSRLDKWRLWQMKAACYNFVAFYANAISILVLLFLDSSSVIHFPLFLGVMSLFYIIAMTVRLRDWLQITYAIASYTSVAVIPAWLLSIFLQHEQLPTKIVFVASTCLILGGWHAYQLSFRVLECRLTLVKKLLEQQHISQEERDQLVPMLLRTAIFHVTSL